MTTFIDKSQPPEADLPDPQPPQVNPSQKPPDNGVLDDPAPKIPHRDPTHANGIAAAQLASSRIAGDVVNKATADLPDNQRSAIRRFHQHYAENSLSLGEAAELINRSSTTLGLIFRGKYGAKLDDVVAEIERFFELADKRNMGRKLQYIETALTRRIWAVCDAAREFQRIAFVFGDQQIGKTTALERYKETHNHGNTVLWTLPAGGVLSNAIVDLAEALRISPALNLNMLRRRIKDSFDDRMLLVVDEAHQAIPEPGHSNFRIQTIEFIREIFNERHCGVVVCATNVFRDAMEKGPVEKILRQTKRRRLLTLQLPNVPTQEDLNTFAAAYGLPPSAGKARDLETRIIADEALGMWLTHLRMAAKIAAKSQQPLEWAHVITAHAALLNLAGIGAD